jgi:predicted nucleotidyltransferase
MRPKKRLLPRKIVANTAAWGIIGDSMIALVEENKDKVAELCRRFDVKRLELFGSAATGTFQAASSDLDFIVRFNAPPLGRYLDRYLDLAEALEELFQRPVDLLTEKAVHNPIFRRNLEATRQPVYERANEEAAA